MHARIADQPHYARLLKLILKKCITLETIVLKIPAVITKCMGLLIILVLAGCQMSQNPPAKLPMGRYLVFASNRVAPHQEFDLFAVRLDQPAPAKANIIQLTHMPGHQLDPSVSPNGKPLLYVTRPNIQPPNQRSECWGG